MSANQKVPGSTFSTQCNHYLLTMSTDEVITFCNNNFSNKFLPDNFSDISFSGMISEKDVHPFRQAFETCLSSPGTCVYGSSRLVNLNEEHHYIKWEMVAESKLNTETAIYLVGHDLHETLARENEMERSRKTLKAIFDSTDTVKFFVAPDFHIQFFNRKAYENGKELHGKNMKVGDNILDYARDTENNVDKTFLEDFNTAIKGETVISESEIEYGTGSKFWFRTEYYPVRENGELIGISVTVSDITERKKHEENIRLQNEKLRRIAFIQSHQVRQPLSNILGILSFINLNGLSDDDKYLMKILSLSANQLDQVVRNIVIEAQQIELEKEYIDTTYNTYKI